MARIPTWVRNNGEMLGTPNGEIRVRGGLCDLRARRLTLSVLSEANLHCHLPGRNLVVFEAAAHLSDLKPPHIADRLASSRDRIVHCVFDAVCRGTDQFNLFVDRVRLRSYDLWRGLP